MFNHYRTLLANLSPEGSDIAEEKIPKDFTPVELPSPVLAFRRVVFGTNPDRAMVNYRTRQLMAVVHAATLTEWVTFLDPRIAYVVPAPLLDGSLFVPVVSQFSGPPTNLSVVGTPNDPDATGYCRLEFTVDVLSDSTVRVSRSVDPQGQVVADYELDGGGRSQSIPLTGSGYSFRLSTDNPGCAWTVNAYVRPRRDLGELTVTLESLGDANLIALFGTEKGEPWETLRRVWRESREIPLRLAAITTAAVYRTEEARRG